MQKHHIATRLFIFLFLLLSVSLTAQKMDDKALVSDGSPKGQKPALLPPDRAAFTFLHYELAISIDAAHSQIDSRGRIFLRNDSSKPQSSLVLQVSSALKWKSVQVNGEALEFVSTTLDSGVDHTGKVNELEAVLPQPAVPGAILLVDVGYSGAITLNADRLRAIGAPAEAAVHTDWDRITPDFTGLRGAGYVVWYPIAVDTVPALCMSFCIGAARSSRAWYSQMRPW